MTLGYFSGGIGRIPHLEAFLGRPVKRIFWGQAHTLTGVIGWGVKETSRRARRYARKHGLPYIALEDGFLRSVGLGVHGVPTASLVVDDLGIYYDATRLSRLEQLIVDSGDVDVARAEACIALMRKHRLTKYNCSPEVDLKLKPAAKHGVLVVDQTAGDASIACGLASADVFKLMLREAVESNPEAEVFVKVHPDVVAGKKKGHLLDLAREMKCTILAQDVSPWSLLDVVDKVFVVTSQLGFEALLAGREVHCFGMPFYAGWGLTQDRQTCERRNMRRTLPQVFHAAYIDYCRYVDPKNGQHCQIEDVIARFRCRDFSS